MVFVGTDLDGLLASKILACLFKQDDVPYRLIPVGGYEELESKKAEVAESGEVGVRPPELTGSCTPLSLSRWDHYYHYLHSFPYLQLVISTL